MEHIYNELTDLCLNSGYIIISKNAASMEARHKSGITFSQMKDGKYVESTIFLASDDVCVSYDIFSGEYTTDLFTDQIKNRETAAAWEAKLSDEVKRLQLANYIV